VEANAAEKKYELIFNALLSPIFPFILFWQILKYQKVLKCTRQFVKLTFRMVLSQSL
jgi:hypothetical protein